ncbi:LamG domain-containing protein [Propionispira raffinosivorans]|uniref:LamG domain-containing protein n=1 Tax=Propionispira raffinosivorans TaxID=86959 RepID=UPI00037A7162|nr:LamG domain-containing protein [Propionispira raffinosivorans]
MYQVDTNTVSLLHFDGDFKDETGKVWTANGSAAISSVQSKFGGKSLYLDGSSYLTTPNSNDFNFGSGDFTIDWWEYRTSFAKTSRVLSVMQGKYPPFVVGQASLDGGPNYVCLTSNGSSWDILNGFNLGTQNLNQLNHYAIVRNGNTFYGFKNGVLTSTATSPLSILAPSANITIGYDVADNSFFPGYIDEFRISNIARWTENFDPMPTKTNNLLRITLNDSSDHDYQLSAEEIAAFVKWYNRHASTDTNAYGLSKKIGTQVSTEYVAFEKIISFEVI